MTNLIAINNSLVRIPHTLPEPMWQPKLPSFDNIKKNQTPRVGRVYDVEVIEKTTQQEIFHSLFQRETSKTTQKINGIQSPFVAMQHYHDIAHMAAREEILSLFHVDLFA